MKKEIQEAKAYAKKEWHRLSELETEINKQSEETVELMRKATKTLSTVTILTVSIFIGSLILSFLLKLTGQPRFLEGAIDFIVIGIVSLVYNWFSQQNITSDMTKILDNYLFLNSHIIAGQLEFKNMKEDLKLSLAIKRGKLGLT